MNKLSVVLLGALALVSCQSKNVIEITTKNIADHTKVEVLTREIGNETPVAIASGTIIGGKATLENPFNDIDEGYLSITEEGQVGQNILFFAEPGKITIEYDQYHPDKPVVGGTENNTKLQKFQELINPHQQKMVEFLNTKGNMLISASASTDPIEREKVQKQFDALTLASNQVIDEFERVNNRAPLGLYMIYQGIVSKEKAASDLKESFDKYPAELKKTSLGKKVQALMNGTNGELAVGKKLPGFKGVTPEGKEITLTSFLEGKQYILVDIWASWCGPCRQENPNLVKTYEAYHSKGFDMIGYSLDKEDTAWKKAIEVDKLAWTQVSNLKYWDDPIVTLYGIVGIPANYLVDSSGTIIAINLKGEELSKKLEELLKK